MLLPFHLATGATEADYPCAVATIAVVNTSFRGHLGPGLRLAATLAGLDHRVIVWAPEDRRGLAQSLGCELVAYRPSSLLTPWRDVAEVAARQARATTECLPDLLDGLLAEGVDVVVHDVQAPWGRVAADYLGLPRIVSNPLYPLWARPPDSGPPTTAVSSPVSGRIADSILAHVAERRRVLARYGIDLGDSAETALSTGEWTISYTTAAVLGTASRAAGWCMAGPLMNRRTGAVQSGRPLVYAALGTASPGAGPAFAVIIEALGELEVDAVLSTGGMFAPEALGPLPANVSAHRFVDSGEILARAAVHVTHGGGSSVHESLVAGVPMLCLPLGSDQRDWARRVVACGAGEIGEYEPGVIGEAIVRLLLSDDARQAAREMAEQLLGHPGPALIGDLIDSILAAESA
jgi:MGT family glycosyltransferase